MSVSQQYEMFIEYQWISALHATNMQHVERITKLFIATCWCWSVVDLPLICRWSVDRQLIGSWSAVDRPLIGSWSLLVCEHNELFLSDQSRNTLSRTYSFQKSKRSTILFFLFSINGTTFCGPITCLIVTSGIWTQKCCIYDIRGDATKSEPLILVT